MKHFIRVVILGVLAATAIAAAAVLAQDTPSTATTAPAGFYGPVHLRGVLVEDEPPSATTTAPTTTLVPTMTLAFEYRTTIGWAAFETDPQGRFLYTETDGRNLFDIRVTATGTANTSGGVRTLTLTFTDAGTEHGNPAFHSGPPGPITLTIQPGATTGSVITRWALSGDDHYTGTREWHAAGVWT